MPQITIGRKVKRATVLTKRTQCLRKYYKERSHRPLYEKLKSNNSYLAKALTQEKQNCQALFTQNIALIAEVQNLRLACNTRDNVISNVLTNAKEMLKMLVTMSGYVTNTISSCQEFVASNTNLRLSSTSVGRKESSKRLSTKSPAKGVVKPMVSGHTITKPTINLSRVNTQHINNSSRLSDIPEVSTPTRNQDINETRTPISVSMPITQLRYENNRTCRMPERLTVSSPRVNADDERRIRKRSYHSKRLSRTYSRSKSNRWSSETPRSSTGQVNQLGSPRVKLNDVSKFLQNSQSINIRTLIENRVDVNIEIQDSSDDTPHNTSDENMIPETEVSVNSDEVDETYMQTSKKDSNIQATKKISNKRLDRNSCLKKLRLSQDRNWEDPLEGPSWLFNNTSTVPPQRKQSENKYIPDGNAISDIDKHTFQQNLNITRYNGVSSDIEDMEESSSSLPNVTKCVSDMQTSGQDTSITDYSRNDSSIDRDNADGSFCAALPVAMRDHERNADNTGSNDTTNFASFVTLRRGNSELLEEETEDFTLMLTRQPRPNMAFNVNELRLPVLEESLINRTVANDIDTEVTATIQRLTNIPLPSISNESMNESEHDQSTIKLPVILIHEYDRMSGSEKKRQSNQKTKNARTSNLRNETRHSGNAVTIKSKTKQKKKSENSHDPCTAKVVLEKLHESHVKLRTPSPDDSTSSSISNYIGDTTYKTEYNPEYNASNDCALTRPRRRKAPVNLKEPSLNKKLRRNR